MDYETTNENPPPPQYSPRSHSLLTSNPNPNPTTTEMFLTPLRRTKGRGFTRPIYKVPVTMHHRPSLPTYTQSQKTQPGTETDSNTQSNGNGNSTQTSADISNHKTVEAWIPIPACRSLGRGVSHGYDFEDFRRDVQIVFNTGVELTGCGTVDGHGDGDEDPRYMFECWIRWTTDSSVLAGGGGGTEDGNGGGHGSGARVEACRLTRKDWLNNGKGLRQVLKMQDAGLVVGLEVYWWIKE